MAPDRYHEGSRELQDRFDTRRLADRLDERTARDHIRPEDAAFIERMDMFFLATADADGRPQCSYKGGEPGFVRVLDAHTLAFPNYDGNGMYLSWGNVLVNPQVGLLFIDFVAERPSRLRVEGIASVALDDELTRELARGAVRRPRARAARLPQLPALHPPAWRSSSARSTSRARATHTPVPDWKRRSAARRACCPPATPRTPPAES